MKCLSLPSPSARCAAENPLPGLPSQRQLICALMFLVLLAAFLPASASGKESEGWGVNALVLKAPWAGAPSADDLLADGAHTVVLDRFYRVGGIDRPATPTECRVSYDNDALMVVFRCTEKDMAFPASDLFYPNTNRLANWNTMFGMPSGTDAWPPFPDEVDVFIQPDPASPSYYEFSVTPDGSKFGRNYLLIRIPPPYRMTIIGSPPKVAPAPRLLMISKPRLPSTPTNGWSVAAYRGPPWVACRAPILAFCRCARAGATVNSAARSRLILRNACRWTY